MPENQEKTSATESLDSSLEIQDTEVKQSATENADGSVIDATQETVTNYKPPKKPFGQRIKDSILKVNVYVLLFLAVLALAGFAAFISYRTSKDAEQNANVLGQDLSAEELAKINQSETSVGDAKQTLTIASNAIFDAFVLRSSAAFVAFALGMVSSLADTVDRSVSNPIGDQLVPLVVHPKLLALGYVIGTVVTTKLTFPVASS